MRSTAPAVHWLGLAWVYSSVLWLAAAFLLFSHGAPGVGLVAGSRLVVTLALGIGLCAGECWAWAPAVSLAVFYGFCGGSLAAIVACTLLTLPPGTLSWMPVFLGLTPGPALRLGAAGALVALVSLGTFRALWTAQPHFDVPHRRPFTTLLQSGFATALLVAMLDALLLNAWWMASVP
jgi:hypothetical protein